MIKTFIYSRVSTQEQLTKSGLFRQEADVRDYVTRNGLDQYEIVAMEDKGVSGYDGSNMKEAEAELGKWYKEAITGMYWGSHLVLEAIDRFSRRDPMLAMEDFTTLVNKGGIKVHIVKMNQVINGDNLPFLSMMMNLAHNESKQKSDRISKGWKRRRQLAIDNGTVITNRTPYWIDVFNNEYRINSNSSIVIEAFDMYKRGLSCGLISKKLNERKMYFPYMWTKTSVQHIVDGLNTAGMVDSSRAKKLIKSMAKTGKGSDVIAKELNANEVFLKEWNAPAVHKLLQNKSVTGLVEIQKRKLIQDFDEYGKPLDLRYKDETEKHYEMVYPQLVSTDDFELIQKLLESNSKVKDRKGNGTVTTNDDGEVVKQFILSGLCRCGMCGSAMYNNIVKTKRAGGKVDTYSYLRCINERDKTKINEAGDICTVKAMNYSVLEKAIIQHVKGLNFDSLGTTTNDSELELLKVQEVELLKDVVFYEDKIKAAKAIGKTPNRSYREGLAESEDALESVQEKIRGIQGITINSDELTNLNDSVHDITEYELRTMVEMELQKLIKRITFGSTEKNVYFASFTYNSGNITSQGIKVDKKRGVIDTYEIHIDGMAYVSNGEVITDDMLNEANKRNISIGKFR
ncbi:TPA: recombinase family protein [Klebsiella aerogenes]|nr:recombinase family protein [Klebsiella pneumoniae]HDS2559596.1 recombinase family protein [Klebsiella aerogenes]